jgi:integrase/recombinase XerD
VTPRDVMAFVTDQRRGGAGAENVARITDASAGLLAATIRRRLAPVSALYGYLVVRGDAG